MDIFYGQVEALEKKLASIPKATKSIQEMTQQILMQTMSSEEEKILDGKIFALVNETNEKAI